MANKEAVVFCVDLGSTMGKRRHWRKESDLDYGLKYVYGKMGDAMGTNRAGLSIGVVGFRTDETNNMLEAEEGYENISILRPLARLELPQFEGLRAKLKPSTTVDGDAISAIVVAVQMITDFTTLKTGKPGAYKRQIVLLTDGRGAMDASNREDIVARTNDLNIELKIV